MPFSFLTTALFMISCMTNITVEAIKKIFDSSDIKYSSNILAAVVSMIIAFSVCCVYVVDHELTVDLKIIIETVILMYFSFLSSTAGYDKVMQTIQQIKMTKVE